jgi:hypothetical protein
VSLATAARTVFLDIPSSGAIALTSLRPMQPADLRPILHRQHPFPPNSVEPGSIRPG